MCDVIFNELWTEPGAVEAGAAPNRYVINHRPAPPTSISRASSFIVNGCSRFS